jgi:hypothetical protein
MAKCCSGIRAKRDMKTMTKKERAGIIEWKDARLLLGQGDAFSFTYDALYQEFADHYAERYNKIVWPFLKKSYERRRYNIK